MIPINNSDLAWLVVSDYKEDNGILGAEELREDIYNPETNQWSHDYRLLRSGDLYWIHQHSDTEYTVLLKVGSDIGYQNPGGGNARHLVGSRSLIGSNLEISLWVGGNEPH